MKYAIIDAGARRIEDGLTIEQAMARATHHARCGRIVGVEVRLDDGGLMYLSPDGSRYWWGDMWSEETVVVQPTVN
jgi:hypothetical protein